MPFKKVNIVEELNEQLKDKEFKKAWVRLNIIDILDNHARLKGTKNKLCFTDRVLMLEICNFINKIYEKEVIMETCKVTNLECAKCNPICSHRETEEEFREEARQEALYILDYAINLLDRESNDGTFGVPNGSIWRYEELKNYIRENLK